ncbi:FtsX-like permease family protein [Demequina activiva]|nr:FtsX-like permease family protein [Demequina activiva]
MREQVRAQRSALVWTGALLTLSLAIASAAFIAAATQWRTDEIVADRSFLAEDYATSVSWWSQGAPPMEEERDDEPGTLAPGELESMVDAALEDGYSARAVHHTVLRIQSEDGSRAVDADAGLSAQYPLHDWATVLIAGEGPVDGEIVLSSSVAEDLDVGVGDVVAITRYEDPTAVLARQVRVSGLSAPSVDGPFWSWSAAGHLTWEDSLEYWSQTPAWTFENGAGEPTQLTMVDVGWQDGAPSMEPLMDVAWSAAWQDDTVPLFDPFVMQGWGVGALAASALVALALLGATFAMGRSQAQVRVEWTATARVLGARRSTIVVASVLETLVLGAVAVALGLVIGWAVVLGVLAWERATEPGVTLPDAPALPLAVLGIVAVLGMVLAAICAVVPAFWSSRVSPAAALKPVTPVSSAQVSRSMSARWLVWISAVTLALVGAGLALDAYRIPNAGRYLAVCGAVSFAVVLIADIVEANRRLVPRAADALARSGRPWALALSSHATSRGRSWATAASIMAFAAGAATAGQSYGVFDTMAQWREAALDDAGDELLASAVERSVPEAPAALGIVMVLALACLVASMVTASARRASRADDAVHAALGLSGSDARRAAAAETALPMVCGIVLGSTAGWALVSLAHLVMTEQQGRDLAEWAAATGLTVMSVAIVAVLALVPITAASAVAAMTARTVSPVEAARVR